MKTRGFTREFEIQWRDVDPNGHMRHTVVGEMCDHIRGSFFAQAGLTFDMMLRHQCAPVLLEYNVRFRREIMLNEKVVVDFVVSAVSKDFRKFKFSHKVYKLNGEVAAEFDAFGGWMDLSKRKLATPPESLKRYFETAPKAEDFQWLP